ncbi:MAG: hypothetical protein M3S32_02605 [Acidobacteriota bacterium]|nr:hypothetical protein [Acidobacteriota bacterium]
MKRYCGAVASIPTRSLVAWRAFILAAAAAISISCRRERAAPATFVPLAGATSAYGELIAVGNHPTPDQYGTGERIGLFRVADGTVWGLPVALGKAREILVCAAPQTAGAPVTDHVPADTVIVGTTNEPTGWRGGTGRLEIVLRDAGGALRWHTVKAAETTGPYSCWAPDIPGPRQKLHYYRLEPSKSGGARRF